MVSPVFESDIAVPAPFSDEREGAFADDAAEDDAEGNEEAMDGARLAEDVWLTEGADEETLDGTASL